MKQRILFLAANPAGLTECQLSEHARAIEEEIGARVIATRSSSWRPRSSTAGRAACAARCPTSHRTLRGPRRQRGDLPDNDHGQPALVTRDAVVQAFDAAGRSVQIAVLSGCSTKPIAQALCEFVPVCVGTSAAISAEQTFRTRFYGGLASRESAVHSMFVPAAPARSSSLTDSQ